MKKKIAITVFAVIMTLIACGQRATTSGVVGGSGDGYVQTLTLSNDTLFSTGTGNAFNDYITGLANLTVDNIFNGNITADTIFLSTNSYFSLLNDSLMLTDNHYGPYSLGRLAQLGEVGTGDGYISNVSGPGNSINFTGQGSAFSGSLTNIAKTNIAQSFGIAAQSQYVLSLSNGNTLGNGLKIEAGGTPGTTILDVKAVGVGSRFKIDGNGNIFMQHLTSGTKSNMVYIDPTTKELFEGTVPSGGGLSDGNYGDITVSGTGTVMDINTGVVGSNELASTGVTSNTYSTPLIVVDLDGRITYAENQNATLVLTSAYQLTNTTDAWYGIFNGTISSTMPDVVATITILISTSGAYYGMAQFIAAYNYNGGSPTCNYTTVYTSSPSGFTIAPSISTPSNTPSIRVINNSGATRQVRITSAHSRNIAY